MCQDKTFPSRLTDALPNGCKDSASISSLRRVGSDHCTGPTSGRVARTGSSWVCTPSHLQISETTQDIRSGTD